MGEVFLADDTQLGRKVAIKFLTAALKNDATARARLHREARSAAALAADLGARGARMGAHDLMIVATAVWLGYDVATRDRRSFARLPDLRVLCW